MRGSTKNAEVILSSEMSSSPRLPVGTKLTLEVPYKRRLAAGLFMILPVHKMMNGSLCQDDRDVAAPILVTQATRPL